MKNLTVVIPLFNGETYITRAIESLLNQTLKDFNILIINDGSLDNTKEIIETFAKNNKNISIINLTNNKGVSYCRTLGIKKCKTNYITFLDHDDWIDINTYEKCLTFLSKNPAIDIVNFGLTYEYLDIDVSEYKYIYQSDFFVEGRYALKIYGHSIKDNFKITPIVNNKIYKLSFLKENNLFFNKNIRYQEDDLFTFKTLIHAKNVAFISKCQYHYFQNPSSTIHQVSELSVSSFIEAYSDLKNYISKNFLFEQYKDEFYLKFKSSLKGSIHRIIRYSNNQKQTQNLLVLLYKELFKEIDLNDFLSYCNLHNL